MPEETIVRFCAPTLAGLKAGALFSVAVGEEEALRAQLRRLNRHLGDKGVRFVLLRIRAGRALIYVFRPSLLRRDLEAPEAMTILRERGYPAAGAERCVGRLIRRLRAQRDFPHEIGLFLGYPPEDVRGFIDNKACGCKCVGCWKVYGDAEKARRLFEAYRRCTQRYCDRYGAGCSIEGLIVPD